MSGYRIRRVAVAVAALCGFVTAPPLAALALAQAGPIPQAGWTLRYVDSEETSAANDAAVNAFDGNPATKWATRWSSSAPPPPHELQVDLGGVYDVSGFRYLPRQDGQPHGNIAQYQFFVSADGTTWGTAVAAGTFANSATEKQVLFGAKTGRYVRLVALSEVNGNPWSVVAELNVLGTGNQPPNGVIGAPSGNVTIAPGGTVSFSGSGSDPDGHLPLTYSWTFGTGGPPASTSQNPGAVTFPNAGVYTVTFTVTDALGLQDPTPATRTVTVQVAPPPAISQAAWTLRFVDSEETSAANDAAVNAFDGSPSTKWATRWSSSAPPPPHEIQIDLGAEYDVSGFRYLPRQDGQQHGNIAQYEFYVSANGSTWGTAVAAGIFANTAAEKLVQFTAKRGRYVRLRALSEVNGNPWTVVAELNVLGTATGNLPPNGTITAPSADVTIAPGGTVSFSGSGSDPDGNLPLTYSWTFGTGGPPPSASQNPGAVVFPTAGVYTVRLTVSDALGAADPTPATRTVTVQAAPAAPISQAGWTLRFVDSEETSANDAAVNAFDGNPATKWATRWSSSSPPPPHEIQIDLGAAYDVSGFRYLPRQDGQPHGNIAQYQFFVSADGTTWGTAVAAGTFANSATEKQVVFAAKTGRYVRLVALSEVNGNPWTVVAELNVLGSGNQPPNGVISAPSGNVTIAPGGTVSFSGSGSDPDGHLPLTYSWTFGTGGPPASTSQNPGMVTFPNAGVYTVRFTVTDALGLADPTPATRTITVQSASSATLIPQSGWALRAASSQETGAGDFAATNAFDGDPDTAWMSRWFNGGPPPPHEIEIDLGATYDVAGFRYLPFGPWQAGRVGDYEFYVSTNGTTWGSPVAAGAFPDLNTAAPRDVMFPVKTGRYVRLRVLSEVNDGDYLFTALAELNVWRAGAGTNQAPTVALDAPFQNVTIPAGSALALAGTASDPDLHAPLSFRWSISGASGVADQTIEDPGYVHFDQPGTFQVGFWVTDALGKTAGISRTVTVADGQNVPNTGWTLRFVDSQETQANNAAVNAFDGNPSTFWATEWVNTSPPPPHEIQIDLGASRSLVGFTYVPRQDGSTIGNIGQYEFYVSADGVNWNAPVVSGTFSGDSSEKQVAFGSTNGRYIRLRALTEVHGLPYSAVAELRMVEQQCLAPSVRLSQPRSGYLQHSQTLALRADACPSAPGQGVRFVLDGVPIATDFTAPYQATAAGVSRSEHVVEAVLVDGSGNWVSGVSTYDVAAPVGIGDVYVALGDGITVGYGDDISTDDNTADGRNRKGGYTSILADALANARGYPVAVINEGKAGAKASDGADGIGALLQKYPNANYFMLIYGHNDADAAVPVPSGLGLTPSNNGYAGSFKHSLQRIIDAVNAAGRTVLLSKPPAVIPVNGADDMRIQEYGRVVAELAADVNNRITVIPPDFHAYFRTRTTTHYSSAVELNGLGYQAMAQLWRDAILGAP